MKNGPIALGVLAVVAVARFGIAGGAPAPGVGVVTVVGPDERPVQGASVQVCPVNAPPGYVSTGRLTGVDGTVGFEGLDGEVGHAVTVTPPQAEEGLAEQDVNSWLPRAGLRVTLVRGRTVRGVTVDDAGKPRRAIVHLGSRDPFKRMSFPGGEHGEFEIRHRSTAPLEILATPYRGEVWIHDELPDDIAWTVVAADAGPIRLPITDLPAPAVVEVTITGPGGVVPDLVRLEIASKWSWRTTDVRGGHMTLTVTSGDEVLLRALGAVATDGSKLDWAPTRARPKPGATRLRVEMTAGRSVAGQVVDEKGVAIPRIVVLATDPESSFSAPLSRAISSEDGRFRIPGLGNEDVTITTLASEGFAPAKGVRAAPGGEDVVVVVRRAVASRIRIVDSAGVAVADAEVTVMEMTRSAGGLVGSGTGKRTGPDGSLDLPPMDSTVHRQLAVRPPLSRDDLAPLTIDAWVPQSGDIPLPKGYVATLRVRDEDDRPVEARVSRWTPPRAGAFDDGGIDMVGPVDSVGVVRVRELPIGQSFFRARSNAQTGVFPSVSTWTPVDDRRPDGVLRITRKGKPLRVRTDRGDVAGLVGTIYADIGGPAFDFPKMGGGALIFPLSVDRESPRAPIVIEQSTARRLEFSQTGIATLPAVAPGRYSILLLFSGGAKPLVGRVDLASFDGADVVVPLVAAVDLRVNVVADGPVEELVGRFEVAGAFVASAKAVGGNLVIGEGLPPGRYQFRAAAKVGGRPMGAVETVETGVDSHITLVEDHSPLR